LQEVGKCAESGSIEEISSPSLQDRFWQESGGNIPVLRDKEDLTRPSLQDFDDPGAFGLGASAQADCVLRTEGSLPGISDRNRGVVPSSSGGFPAGSCGSPGRSSSSRSASVVSAVARTLACRNIGGSLRADREQKAVGSWDWRTGSSGSWFQPPGQNHDLIPRADTGEEQESDQKKMGHKPIGREEENSGMGFRDRPTIGTFSPAKTRDFLTGGDRNQEDFLR
jgi:hypothetical protein